VNPSTAAEAEIGIHLKGVTDQAEANINKQTGQREASSVLPLTPRSDVLEAVLKIAFCAGGASRR
jgi:hypothetical protein